MISAFFLNSFKPVCKVSCYLKQNVLIGVIIFRIGPSKVLAAFLLPDATLELVFFPASRLIWEDADLVIDGFIFFNWFRYCWKSTSFKLKATDRTRAQIDRILYPWHSLLQLMPPFDFLWTTCGWGPPDDFTHHSIFF